MSRNFASFVNRILRRRNNVPRGGVRPGSGRLHPPPRLEALEDRTLLSAGDLDPTFGTGGKVLTSFPTDPGAQSVAVQADGRIVAAGATTIGGTDQFALVRYNSDGSLDSTFGSGGIVTTAFGSTDADANSVVVQSDGRIVAAGFTNRLFALARYNTDGSLDTTFGTAGRVTTSFGPSQVANSLALQSDGRILAAGFAQGAAGLEAFALARYNSDGSLDTSFGIGGKVTTSFSTTSHDIARGVVVQSDGGIVLAGSTRTGAITHTGLARYISNGSLDTTFGNGGLVTTSFGTNQDLAYSVALQSDGQIVAAGTVNNTDSSSFALARYNSNGSLDTSFGSAGLATTSFGTGTFDIANSVAVQADGRLVAAGITSSNGDRFALARYNSDGSPDTSFGTAGLVTTSFGGSVDDAYGVALQADGQIVAAGASNAGGHVQFALARYQAIGIHLIVSAPSTVTAGALFDVTVTATDDSGGVVTGYTGTVTLSSSDPQAASLGSYTFTAADMGMYTFTGLQLFTAGPQSIFASDGSVSAQADLTVAPDVAVALVLSGPSSATAGMPFQVTVTAYDAYGNVAIGYAGTVTFSCTDPAATLPSDYAFQSADQGTQSFSVTLQTSGTQRLTVTDTADPTLTAFLDVTV